MAIDPPTYYYLRPPQTWNVSVLGVHCNGAVPRL